VDIALTPVDNVLLANLCGPLDENIRQIETGFDVVIRRRNERFSITGEKARLTAEALRTSMRMAREPLSVDEIQLGLIEMLNARSAAFRAPPKARRRPATDHPQDRAARPHAAPGGIPEADPGTRHHLRHRPGRHRQDLSRGGQAVDAFERDLVERIILTRPAVEAGERLGFLPGDLTQKVDPYLRPLYDALYDLMGPTASPSCSSAPSRSRRSPSCAAAR
jgi:phosphate starvation-inducible PhoH-like protein